MNEYLKIAIKASLAAGTEIMKVYNEEDFQVEVKLDKSPLTIADKRANEVINSHLKLLGIPIISEENEEVSYDERKQWKECWIVDPLDGTKEFIKKNGEFTVNIALVSEGRPQLGVIYAPALKTLYFAIVSEEKAFKFTVPDDVVDPNKVILKFSNEIWPEVTSNYTKVVGSRSHMNDETKKFIDDLKSTKKEVQVVSKGSSLKFCLLAEGEAHLYPRFGPTMEWDTAAGQAICEAVGYSCKFTDSGKTISYNRENLRNDNFLVSYEG
ncbi:3'(2'),5'-bisphosphate nucleotidase CysQ [Salinimicrobium sp. TH3]|uniref:3'(2'),5'-bisphosphate nucleotidase CysQ n=1 Tax=Salinimicrobium sp. TH3 TaxID=2997342 RepID=UPI002276D16A|nr:3'(2'),5'-bisphosphate nucleotidase CysQ [Salinimicrobium sp. TH3]MCY2686930.1 3'(2'),5'-bisphosphate nucleotidase CysQ [Salinimicrobium sp. TH3]